MKIITICLVLLFAFGCSNEPKYTKDDIDNGWCYSTSNGKIFNIMPPEECNGKILKIREVIKPLETDLKWIEEDGDLIGGTYIKEYGWDFTSMKTGKRYIGGNGRGEWVCNVNLIKTVNSLDKKD